jgi:hypothetical protein
MFIWSKFKSLVIVILHYSREEQSQTLPERNLKVKSRCGDRA